MQLLIVHRDAELGAQLVQMVKDYTSHDCDLAANEADALNWARSHSRCAFLMTQLEEPGTEGLRLAASLSELFPGLQTAFLPGYPRSAQRLEVTSTKVFPEPIDGEAVLAAIERAARAGGNAPDLFHVVDILQMCCLNRSNGAVQMVRGDQSAFAYLRDGQIVHAETGGATGSDAMLQMVAWGSVEFAYDRTIRPPAETITESWDALLVDAVTKSKEQKLADAPRSRARAKLRGAN